MNAALLAAVLGIGAGPGYHSRATVGAPTRLDWTFALANQSLAEPPADWLPDYDSRRQQYELFVPARTGPARPLPLIVFISPGNEPMGWKHFEALCRRQGILFAGPRGAGNDCPPKKRVRIVLDVLDDVRRQVPTDPDRTYLAGFSGGGRIACAVGFALPEYCGGVLPLCAAGDLRSETWLRQRVIDRLSVALVTGTKDFNRGEVERYRGALLRDVGVRTRVWVQPGLGHALPSAGTLTEAVRWLDEGAARRRELARRYPATRVAGNAAPTRADQARALLDEGKKRLGQRTTLYSGLMLLQGCMTRWPDLPTAREARKVLLEYEARPDKPWEADDVAEQRRFLIAQARALDAYASGDLPAQYAKMRPDMVRQAIELWERVRADGPDTPAGREAGRRIPALRKLASSPDR